jgi:hypothetical protein
MFNFKELLRTRSACALQVTRAMFSSIEIYHSIMLLDTSQRSFSPGTTRVGVVLGGLSLVDFFFSFLPLKLYVGLLYFLYFYFIFFAFNF